MNDPFEELSAELDALKLYQIEKRKAKKQKDPLDDLWETECKTTTPPQVWEAVAGVFIIESRLCTTCDNQEKHAVGWFTEHRHKTDSSARRLVAGRPQGLPARVEYTIQTATTWCANCAESQLAIEHFLHQEP